METKPVILITGCSSGIGYNLALHLTMTTSCIVYATVRASPETTVLHSSWGEVEEKDRVGQLHIVQMDVTVPETIQKVVGQIVQEQSRLDIVINNAGKSLIGFTESVSVDQAKEIFEVNFWGVAKLLFHNSELRAAAELLLNNPALSFYNASKAAIESLHKSEAPVLKEQWNIHMSLVQPSLINASSNALIIDSPVGNRIPAGDEKDSEFYSKYSTAFKHKMGQMLSMAQPVKGLCEFVAEIMTAESPSMCYPYGVFASNLATQHFIDPSGNSQLEAAKTQAKATITHITTQ